MSIDYAHFTPEASLVGALLIGLSATIHVLGLGRITGIAGIVGTALQGLTRGSLRGQGGGLSLLLDMVAAPVLWSLFRPLPPMTSVAGTGTRLAAGRLVGAGVRMGNGCTSGHGVCGLSRYSPRSFANVLAFMGLAVPALVVGLGRSMQQAAPVALMAVAGGAGIGALTGFMTGLLGVGGGFVIVPPLRRFTELSMHGIVATSLLVIVIVGGVLTALLRGAVLPLELTLLFTAATAAGMLAGRYASHRLSAAHVQVGFAIVLLVVALGLLVKAALNV